MSTKRLMHRYQSSGTAFGLRAKLRVGSGSRLNPQRDAESSMCQDLNKTMNPRLLRQLSNELLAGSPYALSKPMARSKSAAKSRNRPARQSTPDRRPKSYAKGEAAAIKPQFSFTPLLSRHAKRRHVSEKPPLNQSVIVRDSAHALPQQLNLSFSNSFNTSLSALPSIDSPRMAREVFSAKLRGIGAELQSKLANTAEADWRAEIEACGKAVRDIMTLEDELCAVLSTIVLKYEGWVNLFSDRAAKAEDKVQAEIHSLQDSLLQEIEEKKALKRKFEKISRENMELCRSCETYQNKCFEFQEKLFDIAGVSLDAFPPSEKSWRFLVSELEAHRNWKDGAVRELKAAQTKERKLLQLLHAIKKRGVPVEEVYNEDVRRRSSSQSSASGSEVDEQPLTTGPAFARSRPECVPALQIASIVQDTGSDSASSVQPSTLHDSQNRFLPFTTLSNSSTHSNLTSSEKAQPKPVPQLRLPAKADSAADGFHQEFMAKYPEFSESWRRQIDAQKH